MQEEDISNEQEKNIVDMLVEDLKPPQRLTTKEKKLTQKIKDFLELIAIHKKSPYHAYLIIYPKAQRQGKKMIMRRIGEIMSRPLVKAYYERLLKADSEALVNKAVWSREESIIGLRKIYDLGLDEVNRIETSYQMEYEYLNDRLSDAIKAGDNKLIAELHDKILKLIRTKRISKNGMDAMKDAISELNKLNGLNSETVNHNTAVTFIGEENMLE